MLLTIIWDHSLYTGKALVGLNVLILIATIIATLNTAAKLHEVSCLMGKHMANMTIFSHGFSAQSVVSVHRMKGS